MNEQRKLQRHELGFLQLANPPDPKQLAAYYEKKYFQDERGNYRHYYSDDELAFARAKIEQLAYVVETLRGSVPGTMLDVGCGEGFALAWHASRGWRTHGIDFSDVGIRNMHPERLDDVETGDLFKLLEQQKRDGHRYDLLWLSNVLEHVLDPIRLLRSVRQLIQEGGVLVITVPNDGSELQEMLLRKGCIDERFWIAVPDHISYFDYESLTATAAATGWRCRDVLADFPIDLFLLHDDSNYVRNRDRGPKAHWARVQAELLIHQKTPEQKRAFYSAIARVGLGRNLTAFLQPE